MEYVGVHSTDNMNDNYMGSGTYLRNAIRKYGVQHFVKEIIRKFDTRGDALSYEAYLADETYVGRLNVYNLVLGGGMPIGRHLSIKKFKRGEEKQLFLNWSDETSGEARKYKRDYNASRPIKFYIDQEKYLKYKNRVKLIRRILEVTHGITRQDEMRFKITDFVLTSMPEMCDIITDFYNDKRYHKEAMKTLDVLYKRGYFDLNNGSMICIKSFAA